MRMGINAAELGHAYGTYGNQSLYSRHAYGTRSRGPPPVGTYGE